MKIFAAVKENKTKAVTIDGPLLMLLLLLWLPFVLFNISEEFEI